MIFDLDLSSAGCLSLADPASEGLWGRSLAFEIQEVLEGPGGLAVPVVCEGSVQGPLDHSSRLLDLVVCHFLRTDLSSVSVRVCYTVPISPPHPEVCSY